MSGSGFGLEISDGGGIARIAKRFAEVNLEWEAATVAWADVAGPHVADVLRSEAPTRTGRLRDSLRYQRVTLPGNVRLEFHTNVPYYPFVVHGTSPHIISAVAANALHWHDGSGDHFAAYVHHPGTKPNNFPQRTKDNVREELITTYMEALRRVYTIK